MPERERTSPQYESFHELYKNNTTKELTQKAKSLKLTNYSKLNVIYNNSTVEGSGPQHREFQREILQTKQVGVKYINRFNSKLSFSHIL